MTLVAAFDVSLTCTGFATSAATRGEIVAPASSSRGVARLQWVRDAILERAQGADVVVLEGYAFDRPNQAHQIGELGGVVRVALVESGHAYVEIAPATLKMFATGHGNAGKAEVLAAAIRKLEYDGHSTDVADALWLCRMATLRYTSDDLLAALNVKQQQALASVRWPTLEAIR